MPIINMLSSADKVKGQGVGSAYIEQVNLVKKGLDSSYEIVINRKKICDIMHYHSIDLKHYLFYMTLTGKKGVNVGYVHFLPETVDDSIKLPAFAKKIFYKYIISFYKRMDYLVTVNSYFIDELAKYGIDRNKITYIPNYVSLEKFYSIDEDAKLKVREKYAIPKDKFVVLGVGQVQTRKGITDFIEIAKRLPDVQFVWAGGFSFGSITAGYKELKKIVDNPPDNVKFLGILDRENMNDVYNMANLMFLPSYQELFPMTILESFNCKTPILLRDIDIYPKVFFDFYQKGSTIEEFIGVIDKLRFDADFYTYCCDKSWEGHKFYSEEHVLEMWKEFYDKVYAEKVIKNQRKA